MMSLEEGGNLDADSVTVEAEIDMMLLQANENLELLADTRNEGEVRKDTPLESNKEHSPSDTWISDFQPLEP